MTKARALKKYRGGGNSNELEDLVFRLSLAGLPIHESVNIVNKLGVTDLISFKMKTDEFSFRSTTERRKIQIIKDNITREGDAEKIKIAIDSIREEIRGEEESLKYLIENYLNYNGNGIINKYHNNAYMYAFIRTLQLRNIYDLIDAKPKDINDIDNTLFPQIYKEKLLALRTNLKKETKGYTFLMKTKFLTQHEAIYVCETLGIKNPINLKFKNKQALNNIEKLTIEKREKLWNLIVGIKSGKKFSSSS
jgi:hypothetical protein